MFRRLTVLLALASPLCLSGCFICILKSGTGEHVGVLEEFFDETAQPAPLPPSMFLALQAVEKEGRPAILIRYRVPPAGAQTGVADYFGGLLEERRLPRTIPYMLFNGMPAIVGGPPPGATASPHELGLADIGLSFNFGRPGARSTVVGWWHIGDGESLNLTADIYFLRGRVSEGEPPVFEVAELLSLGRQSSEGNAELGFVPGPEDAVALLARNAETLETLNVLWVTPDERKSLYHEGYDNEVWSDASHQVFFDRRSRKEKR